MTGVPYVAVNKTIMVVATSKGAAASAIRSSNHKGTKWAIKRSMQINSFCMSCPLQKYSFNATNQCPLYFCCPVMMQPSKCFSSSSSSSSFPFTSNTHPKCQFCGVSIKRTNSGLDLICCQNCGRLQAKRTFSPVTYFDLLNNNLVVFNLDLELIRDNYYKLQRALHPDRFQTTSTPDELTRIAADWSAFVNRGYETLKDPLKRAIYIYNLMNSDEPYDLEHSGTSLTEDELFGILELREQIEAVAVLEDCTLLFNKVKQARTDIISNLSKQFTKHDFKSVNHSLDTLKFYETIIEAAEIKLGEFIVKNKKT